MKATQKRPVKKRPVKKGLVYPPGSLKHLYTAAANRAEVKLARCLRIPSPDEV